MTLSKPNVFAIGSVIGAAIFWGWQPLVAVFTGEFNQNLIVQISAETIETCTPEKLLVLHIEPQNRGNVPLEIGGKKGGAMVVTVKRIPLPLAKDQWVDPKLLPKVAEVDVLKEHPDGYMIERSVSYDEVETIALQPGIYWAGIVVTFGDGDYVDQSIVVKVDEGACPSSASDGVKRHALL